MFLPCPWPASAPQRRQSHRSEDILGRLAPSQFCVHQVELLILEIHCKIIARIIATLLYPKTTMKACLQLVNDFVASKLIIALTISLSFKMLSKFCTIVNLGICIVTLFVANYTVCSIWWKICKWSLLIIVFYYGWIDYRRGLKHYLNNRVSHDPYIYIL